MPRAMRFPRLSRIGSLVPLLAALLAGLAAAATVCVTPPLPRVCDPGATLLRAIAAARRQIRMQIYTLTSRRVVAALEAARARGVDVRVIVDRSALRDDRRDAAAVGALARAGIAVRVDTVRGLMHDKITLIDGTTALTGSYNYTWSAEHRNAENLVVLRDPAAVSVLARNWAAAAARSVPVSAQTLPASVAAGPAGAVRGNQRTHIYQWPGCRYYDRIAPRNRVAFPSAAAARAAGYRAADCR
jgi:phosphatidylserine/phosphatidylglycerophosphate/cardiolipin synthase-like enzyme